MSLYEYERDGDAQALIGVLKRGGTESTRQRAAELLGEFDDHDDRADVVSALVEAARSGDGPVVAAAVDALDSLGQDALEALIADLADVDPDAPDRVRARAYVRALSADLPELRMAAANALGDVGEPETVGALSGRFEDPDPRVRARAARACGQLSDPRVAADLESLLSDEVVDVRREAAEALGAIGNRRALRALLDQYDDDSEVVRRIAVQGLGAFENDRPVDQLVDALSDPAASVRRAAVYSLIELLSNVPTEQSHEIRETVVDRLSATDDETVVTPLVGILTESTRPAQRRNTAWLLGRVTDAEDADTRRRVVDALVDALADGEGTTRQFAATSLARIGEGHAERALLDLAEDTGADSEARAQAVFALGKIGGERTRERLEGLLEATADEAVRQRAVTAISKLGGQVS